MNTQSKSNLTIKILLALFLGVLTGLILKLFSDSSFVQEYIISGLFFVIGKLFVSSLTMLVVPLVFVSLVCGVYGLEDISKLGRLGAKTFILYVITTGLAISMALFLAIIFKTGTGFNLPTEATFSAPPSPPLSELLIDLIPSNPIQAAASGNMLQIIVFAIIFGAALANLDKRADKISGFFNELNDVIMNMVKLLMAIAPYGVFALIAQVFYQQGVEALLPLMNYFCTVILALILHLFVFYGFLLKFVARINPIIFFRKMRPVMAFAFSTASSNATIPVSMRVLTERIGVSRPIAAFSIPLGATVNMDGTAIMQGVATIFIAHAYQIEIGFISLLTVVLTATLASIGTAGVPGVGLVTLTMVLKQVGLPVEGIALIIGVDRFLDMVRTVVNVTGDSVIACVVANSEENGLDRDILQEA